MDSGFLSAFSQVPQLPGLISLLQNKSEMVLGDVSGRWNDSMWHLQKACMVCVVFTVQFLVKVSEFPSGA